MDISKDEIGVLNKVKRKASLLSENALIVSKPGPAKAFLAETKSRIVGTRRTYKKLIEQVKLFKHLTHEVENLFDNYYIVDNAISDVLNSGVDRGFRKLVQMEKKPGVFIPRIYFILTELLKISDYKMDRDTLYSFLQAYQAKAHLSIRELSFVPFFLKIILIENVEHMMQRSMASLSEYKEAEFWFGEIVKKGKAESEKDFSKLTSEMTAKYGVIPVNLGFHLLQKLSQYGPDTRPLVKWLKLNLLKQGIDIGDLVAIENKRQNDISVLITNTINSLRWINQARWDDFVVDVNIVDSFLLKDPSGLYGTLDQASQASYRNEVVKVGDRAGVYESEVAKLALRLCHLATLNTKFASPAESHIGYYLVGNGREELYKRIGYRRTFFERLQAFLLKKSIWVYLGLILAVDIVLTGLFAFFLPVPAGQIFTFIFLVGLVFLLNSDIAVNLVNILVSSLVPVRALFRLDLSSGLSDEQSTFLVVPSMFRGKKESQELLRRLEVNFLSNTEDKIYYALLMDFKDAPMESLSADRELVEQMRAGIEALNEKYPSARKRFYLFHRKRLWNAHENVFMGWERKRGKLREFNLLLRDKKNTSYVEAFPDDLPKIKYVLTIDEDTRLPRESAVKLIGCLDHPLNRPVLDPITGQVKSGYGIIQPRMTTKFAQAESTPFARLFSSAMGIDSYSGPVADVYQDLFNNSIFYGKGIYDVDTMESTIGDRLPENQVLSHDLLEGLYTKVGFATDIFLFEGFPESYKEYILRMHRWIRGDWQIVGWLRNGGRKDNHFNLSDKWKIIDNLRRSVLPALAVLFLLTIVLAYPASFPLSLLYILILVGSPFVISYIIRLFEWPREMTLFMKINMALDSLDDLLWQMVFRFIFLLDQAIISFRAVGVSIYRLIFSRNHMLLWQNSHEVSKSLKGTVREFIYLMLPAQIISLLGIFVLFEQGGIYFFLTMILWFISPLIAYAVSQRAGPEKNKPEDLKILRQVACRSARFFLELSGRENNRLIPDHYQEEPVTNSPAATSPTNIGMHLLSNLSALDFGYVSLPDFIERTAELCRNLNLLERYRGHFYNWYDIRTLQVLNPKYVSSVDSANLLLAILTLKQGILEIERRPVLSESCLQGLSDVVSVLAEDAELIIKDRAVARSEKRLAKQIRAEARRALGLVQDHSAGTIDAFSKLFNLLTEVNDKIRETVSRLVIVESQGRLGSIYLSAEHLNTLLRQQKDVLNRAQSSNKKNQDRPIAEYTFESLKKSFQAEAESLDFIIHSLDRIFDEMDFSFLYNKERGLFHIGYNVTYEKIDNSYYDFLASEANSISFVAILKKQVPIKHWFYLGRKLVRLSMNNVLLSSWGGSLFEYLTSHIFFKVHDKSLLGHTANLAIDSHIKYGQKFGLPWGMGESAYSALDLNNNYQYQIFGHPSLGFKRDLKDYLVVAPYTTLLSLPFRPRSAIANIKKLIKIRLLGRYGFYDAIDYSAVLEKDNTEKDRQPARIYYAHHQGFSLQALNNYLNNNRLQALFSADPRVEALDTLFEEKMPSSVPAYPIKSLERLKTEYLTTGLDETEAKQFVPLFSSYPRRAFISNGSYFVDVSNSGAGGSKAQNYFLTRFREDPVAEPWGQFIYLYDADNRQLWSPTTMPCGVVQGKNKIEYFENKAQFNKIHNEIESALGITVSADTTAEFRTLTLTNHSSAMKNLRVASYGEVSLSKNNEDLHHPAFEKLFVKSDYWQKYNALVYTKPNKTERGEKLYFAHQLLSSVKNIKSDHTTDRSQFVARGGFGPDKNVFTTEIGSLKSNLGYNFDPIFCFQNKLTLRSNETITLTYVNIFAHSEEELRKNLKRYSNIGNVNQALKKADLASRSVINNLGLSGEQALEYQILASRLLSPQYAETERPTIADSEEAGVQSLWRLGLSGDRPILVLRFYDLNDLPLVKNILLGHKYLKYKGVAHDLVLLNEYPSSYLKSFEDEVDFLIRYNPSADNKMVSGYVYHLRASHLAQLDKDRLLALARVVLDSKLGTLDQQIALLLPSGARQPAVYLKPEKKILSSGKDVSPTLERLKFYNGLGGFAEKDREYVLNVNYDKGMITPVPWTNILANKNIGSVVTEGGSMYTWLFDSYDNRLTKRIDDPLTDRSSEVFYLRDEETGEFWCPTPLPVKSAHTYTVSHGLGYTEFSHKNRGLKQEMLAFVPVTDSVKVVKIKVENMSKVPKKLSLTAYFEMALGGALREDTKNYLKTTHDKETGALIIKNYFNESFKKVLGFADLALGQSRYTNDRDEFLGRNGEVSEPSAMKREKLSNTLADNVDHCVALQTFFELAPGEEREITALLGGGQSLSEVRNLINKYRDRESQTLALAEIKENWRDILDKVKIKTPDDSLNLLFNDRLLYQMISSRLLARTGYYQPSGAYGFRDQLQDALALVWSKPEMTKEIILKAARHQFLEGDAMNWWHEHNNFGVRSAFSDHQLWLTYVTASYVEITGENNILTERMPYLKAPLLDFINNAHWAGVPETDLEKFDLYDHCSRALEKTFVFGRNGLPLIGNGDWNDGLNKVGERGAGESVWLGWFLYAVIKKFLPFVEARGDFDRLKKYELTAKNLKRALEQKAWDGKWYKRAFFDNGLALGSRANKEYKIDSVAQSWAVLSRGASPEHARQAMNAVSKNLFQDDLLLLLSPALKEAPFDPGYIKDYPAGVRENGAQYNHAALWSAQAFAEIGDSASLMKIINSVNPIKRSENKEKAKLYRVEPYVVASDIYAKPVTAGRGGWTWYTGSAGVMYRTVLENLLGILVRGNKMEIKPCLPKDWSEFSLVYTHKTSKYHIQVINSTSVTNKKIRVDGELLAANIIYLMDDGKKHEVEVKI